MLIHDLTLQSRNKDAQKERENVWTQLKEEAAKNESQLKEEGNLVSFLYLMSTNNTLSLGSPHTSLPSSPTSL